MTIVMENDNEVFDANVTIRGNLQTPTSIKELLSQTGNERRNSLFRSTQFGKWLDFPSYSNDNLLLNYIFQQQVKQEPISDHCPPITYKIEDLAAWDGYAWGEYFWRAFYTRIVNVIPRHLERENKNKKKNKSVAPKKNESYNVHGCVWALKIYIRDVWKQQILVEERPVSYPTWSILVTDRQGSFSDNCIVFRPVDEKNKLLIGRLQSDTIWSFSRRTFQVKKAHDVSNASVLL
nr:hypothetical protein [Tanacetum cinerariifolium]